MRRLIAALVLVVTILCSTTPADAFWRHHGWGWGRGWGGWGYRRVGWGYPYRAGFGYPYYGGYGYGYPYYSGYAPWYGCYNNGGYGNYGTTVGLSYPGYGLASTAYRPPTNLIVMAPPASSTVAPARAAPPAATINLPPAAAMAVQKFLGLKDIHPVALGRAPAAIASAPAATPLRGLGDILARVSNVESRRKAERMLNEGDELFRAQNYHSALQRYKLAASTAPDLAEALWRQGHALVATHNYDLATTAFKRAIALTEDLGRDGFRLNDIYGGAAMTKNQHVESLAEWAATRRSSPDPYFLLGLFLEYDGQQVRAEKFFQKASDLAGISGGHIAVFLAPAELAPAPRFEPSARPAASLPVIPISTGTEI